MGSNEVLPLKKPTALSMNSDENHFTHCPILTCKSGVDWKKYIHFYMLTCFKSPSNFNFISKYIIHV